MLAHDGSGGAAGVQVDFLISKIGEHAYNGEERMGAVAEYLRHELNSAVVFGENVTQVAGFEVAPAVRGDKRRIIDVCTGKKTGVENPVYVLGDTLQGGEA